MEERGEGIRTLIEGDLYRREGREGRGKRKKLQ